MEYKDDISYYSLSHYDTDGVIASICMSKVHHIHKFMACGYGKLQSKIDEIIANGERNVIITDISLTVDMYKQLEENTDNFIYIDHHHTSVEVYEYMGEELDESQSAAGLCWDYCGNPEYLHSLVRAGDAYDMWQTGTANFPRGYKLNEIFWDMNWWKFFSEYEDGFSGFTDDQTNFLKYKLAFKKQAYKDSVKEYFDEDKKRMFILLADPGIGNDITLFTNCDDYFIVRHQDGIYMLSVRTKRDDWNVGIWLRELAETSEYVSGGGGHPKAGGAEFTTQDLDIMMEVCRGST